MENIYTQLINYIDKERICKEELMSQHTSLKIGGPADLFIKVKDLKELKYIINLSKDKKIPLTVIGNGSNILVKDRRN